MNIYGKNAIREALKGGHKMDRVIFCENIKDEEIQTLANKKGIRSEVMKKSSFQKAFGDKTGGVVAIASEYEYLPFETLLAKASKQEECVILLLDGLEDPHNLGAILRSCDATGVLGVVLPKNRSVHLNETVAKVSTGAIEHVDCCVVTNLNQTIEALKNNGFWIIGLELSGTIDYRDADYKGKVAIVVGSEGKGIAPLVQRNCDLLVKIPMNGKVNSLNASVSAGIILYEAIRHRRNNG